MPLLVDPDTALTVACRRPVRLPDTDITQEQLESYWRTDRLRLRACALKHAALRQFYAQRDAELRGDAK